VTNLIKDFTGILRQDIIKGSSVSGFPDRQKIAANKNLTETFSVPLNLYTQGPNSEQILGCMGESESTWESRPDIYQATW
jgi:hypothetical protein